ncbi:MAG TPA: DUF4157 domain-containing protein [Longimicrobium sp.]|nr:DUF4157 domain-containing protein [Longimicrobium sp.]
MHDVLRSPGRPLDAAARADLEPRFGHSFADVRVHTDSRAAESAAAVGARAYTVGRDVVFGAGGYAPASGEGRRLLAHELAHVVQQRGVPAALQPRLEVGSSDAPEEREAEAAAATVVRMTPIPRLAALRTASTVIQRQAAVPVELVPASPDDAEWRKEHGIDLPTVSEETWRLIGGKADNAGKKLAHAEKVQIATLLKMSLPAGPLMAFAQGPRFVVHDTASPVSASTIATQAKLNRGSLGKGVYAWVPAAGDLTITRQTPFEANRPSATEWEKWADEMTQADREKEFRAVWNAALPSQRQSALDRALDGLTKEEAKEEKSATKEHPSIQDQFAGGKIFTAGSWAVREICAKAASDGAASVAAKGKETALEAACSRLKPYFAGRKSRVESTTNVEIVQNDTTVPCANPEALKKPPKLAYTDVQYQGVTLLYLRAALAAGVFPEITTHFWVDSKLKGHCDPRCFNLNRLYDQIAASLGHGKGSSYGVKPSYGKTWGTHNVWWYNPVCGAKP